MKESNIQREIMCAVSQLGTRVFRNNVGKAWIGQSSRLESGDVLIRNPRRFHAGLCEGSSDLIGWHPLLITEEHIGKTLAVFTGIEVKTKTGRLRPAQAKFVSNVTRSGGICFVARSVDDAVANLDEPLAHLT